MSRITVIIAVLAIAAASCTGNEMGDVYEDAFAAAAVTSTSPTTTIDIALESTTTTTNESDADTTTIDSGPKVSWVEYDACIQARWHEEGIAQPPGELRHPNDEAGSYALGGPELTLALMQIREMCAPWRPVPYEEPEYTGHEILSWLIPYE